MPLPAQMSTEELLAEIARLSEENRERRDPNLERQLVALRHLTGMRLMESPVGGASFPEPAFEKLPARNGELPGVRPDELTPELVRAGILRDGCLLVRGLIDPDAAERLVGEIDRAFEAREELAAGSAPDPSYYEEFEPDPRFLGFLARDWVSGGGGLWVADSPHAALRDARHLRANRPPSGDRGTI